MGIKVKKSPKPATNESPPKKAKVTPGLKEKGKKTQGSSAKKAALKMTVRLPDAADTTSCELKRTQVDLAVRTSFKAFEFSHKKANSGKLFESDPEPIYLLVSSIKISDGPPHPLYVKLPHPFLNNDSDVCLVVKDLKKGWREDHEPTMHHYKELLQKKNVSCVSEIMPLRQLRIEHKPYEARLKLSKRFDTMLVDKRVAKYIPRYLGKSFYQSAKLPVALDLGAKNLSAEFDQALATSTMSITNNGSSMQIQIGLTNQTETAVAENVLAVYEIINESFPGKFANVRNLTLRFGSSKWTVPIYISYATRDSVVLPIRSKHEKPLIDELTTLGSGWKVAVYPSGKVKRVKIKGFKKTSVDEVSDNEESEDEIEDHAERKSGNESESEADNEAEDETLRDEQGETQEGDQENEEDDDDDDEEDENISDDDAV